MRPYGDEPDHPADAPDDLDEYHLIDEICVRLLAQPARYVHLDGPLPFTTATWEDEQLRVPPASEAN
jgi:hypothetical protein